MTLIPASHNSPSRDGLASRFPLDNSLDVLRAIDDAIATLDQHPWIVAHRGDWRTAPENSIEAALGAFALGADMVEIDAQSIADGSLVVIHDDTLDRTTSLSGLVRDMTPAMLASARLRASDGLNGAALTTTALPTLPQMLEALRGKGLINIDTKMRDDLDAACATVIAMGMTDQVLMKMIVTHDDDGSEFLDRAWFGKVAFMPVILDAPKGALVSCVTRIVDRLRAPMVEIQFRDLDELRHLSGLLASRSVGIWTNTLDPVHSLDLSDSRALTDPAAVWGHLLDCGVAALQTDQTAALAAFLGRGGAHHAAGRQNRG